MKFFAVVLTLVVSACATNKPAPERIATRTIYYSIKGIPVELEKNFRAKFEAFANQRHCHRPTDWQNGGDRDICVRYLPHMNQSPITWNRDSNKKDMLLWINVSQTSEELGYSLKFECSDGEKIVGCFNPGKFKLKRKGGDDAQVIFDDMVNTPIILGIK